ncbi:MAG: hypothetical protein R6U68_04255 [Desulfobacteraceae bacterium]
MSKETTDALMLDFRRNTRGIVLANNLRIMPNARYSSGTQNTRFIDVTYNKLQRKYEIKFQVAPFYANGKYVQYLPWASNAGIYIILQAQPPVFFTDKLTGCFLAFDFETPKVKISHLNFIDYSPQHKRKTLESYSHCHVLCPEDYHGNTTVFGVHKGQWEFFFQVENGRSGRISMVERANQYGTKSVLLN